MDWKDELRQYIALQLSSGKTRAEIEQMLLQSGWKSEMYGPVLQEMAPAPSIPPYTRPGTPASPSVSSQMNPTIPTRSMSNLPSSFNTAGGAPTDSPHKPGIPKMYLLAGIVLLVAVFLGAVLLTQGGGPAKNTGIMAATNTTAPAVQPPASSNTSAAAPSASSAKDRMLKLAGTASRQPFVLNYTLKMTRQAKGAAVRMYLSDSSLRMDMVDTPALKFRTYILNQTTSTCTKSGTDSWTCAQSGADSGVPTGSGWIANLSNSDVSALPGRTLAGMEASCFNVTATGIDGEYCYSPAGVMLYIHRAYVSNGQPFDMTIEATSAPAPASDADFVLPTGRIVNETPGAGSGADASSATEQNTPSGQDCSALRQNQSAEDDCYFQRALNENNRGECYNMADMTKVTECLNKFK